MTNSSWASSPPSPFWSDENNWTNDQVPDGEANFDLSTQTSVQFAKGAANTVGGLTFTSGSNSYSFLITEFEDEPSLTINGNGVSNDGLSIQSFNVASYGTYRMPQLKFAGQANAGGETVMYYAGPTSLENGFGGGTIGFYEDSNAGSARFTVRTGKVSPHEAGPDHTAKQIPPGATKTYKSTLGGSVVFNDRAGGGSGLYSLYGTLGEDGDTFGNVVFHDTTSAQTGTFINYGGTVPGGDGGNTQFYDKSTAGAAVYINYGGTADKPGQWGGANGGDVAFDGVATGGTAWFQNYPASIAGAHGGVTSFNNNPNFPAIDNPGATAGNGIYVNYGATADFPGGGGHTEFTARYGKANAGQGTFVNFAATQGNQSEAGHTIFAISAPNNDFGPSAENGTFWNLPGNTPGYTEFLSYGSGSSSKPPDAGNGTFYNLGSYVQGESGGQTLFKNQSNAASATLIAYGGIDDTAAGAIYFSDDSTGGDAHVILTGNGTLSAESHSGGLTIGQLTLAQGVIAVSLDNPQSWISVSQQINYQGGSITLRLCANSGFKPVPGTRYLVLEAPELDRIAPSAFVLDVTFPAGPGAVKFDGSTLYVEFAA